MKFLIEKSGAVWCNTLITKFDDQGKIIEQWMPNLFYDVKDNFITIYETTGGSGYGYSKGDILNRINIAGCELETKAADRQLWFDFDWFNNKDKKI